jgi:hypothetical protein
MARRRAQRDKGTPSVKTSGDRSFPLSSRCASRFLLLAAPIPFAPERFILQDADRTCTPEAPEQMYFARTASPDPAAGANTKTDYFVRSSINFSAGKTHRGAPRRLQGGLPSYHHFTCQTQRRSSHTKNRGQASGFWW